MNHLGVIMGVISDPSPTNPSRIFCECRGGFRGRHQSGERPRLRFESARETIAKWFDPERGEHLIEGLHKAGLEIDGSPTRSASPWTGSGPGPRADEGFWVEYQKDIELRRPNARMIAFAGFLKPLRASPRRATVASLMNLP